MAMRSLGTDYDAPEEIIMFELAAIFLVLEEVAFASKEGHHDLAFVLHGQVYGKAKSACWCVHVSSPWVGKDDVSCN